LPFIREYSEGDLRKEPQLVTPSKKSPIETALHETLHAVILRLDGLDISDVVDTEDAAWTRLLEPQKYTVAALMTPEIYMILNDIEFTEESVSSDRNAVFNCIPPEAVEEIWRQNRALLENMFQCPGVRSAIGVLSEHMAVELREHKIMYGDSIHGIIDPILKHSPYADDLRERLSRAD
jgi:hypothetical protein